MGENFKDPENRVIYNELSHMRKAIDEIKQVLNKMSEEYITKNELDGWKVAFDNKIENIKLRYDLPKKILYGAIGLILIGVFSAIISLVIMK